MKKRLLIVYSGDVSASTPGGIFNYIKEFIKTRDDLDIDLLALSSKGKPKELADIKCILFKPILKPLVVSFLFSAFLFFLTKLKNLTVYSAVIFNRPEDAILQLFFSRKTQRILLIHGSVKYGFMFWPYPIALLSFYIENIVVRFMNSIYVLLQNENYGVPFYQKTYKKQAQNIKYAPVPVSKNFLEFQQKIKNHNSSVVKLIYFGRIINNPKNVFLLPKLVKSLLEDNIAISLTVVGDGMDLENLKVQVAEMSLNSFIRFHGHANHDALPQLVSEHDFSLILSSFEGICMSALESLAVNVPVIAYSVGDIASYICNGKNGLILNDKIDFYENTKIISKFIKNYKPIILSNEILKSYHPETAFSHIKIF
jgi:glycosyltransferase involved in cell wall biosynthesis